MLPIRLRWQRPRDGYAAADPNAPELLTARSKALESYVREDANLEAPLVLRLINGVSSPGGVESFVSRFGSLDGAAQVDAAKLRSEASRFRSDMERTLTMATRHAKASDHMNRLLADVAAKPLFVFLRGEPRLVLQASTLADFMALEVATAFEVGARLGVCRQCNKAFLTGPLTGRRGHARYCSDKCRVAAMRARNAAKGS